MANVFTTGFNSALIQKIKREISLIPKDSRSESLEELFSKVTDALTPAGINPDRAKALIDEVINFYDADSSLPETIVSVLQTIITSLRLMRSDSSSSTINLNASTTPKSTGDLAVTEGVDEKSETQKSDPNVSNQDGETIELTSALKKGNKKN